MDAEFLGKFEKLLEDVPMIKGMCSESGALKEEVAVVRSSAEQNSTQMYWPRKMQS